MYPLEAPVETSSHAAGLRLKTIVEADPGALVRLLQLFQIRNLVPRRVRAQRLGDQFIEAEIELDSAEIAPETLRLIAAKLQELPITMAVVASD
jgi:prephenate dehydratase